MAVLGAPVAVIAAPAGLVLAEAASTNGGVDVYSLIGTLITPVIVVALLLAGKFHTGGDYDRVVADLAEERAERVRLQNVVNDRVIPGMARATLVMEALLPSVENEVRLRAARDNTPGGG